MHEFTKIKMWKIVQRKSTTQNTCDLDPRIPIAKEVQYILRSLALCIAVLAVVTASSSSTTLSLFLVAVVFSGKKSAGCAALF